LKWWKAAVKDIGSPASLTFHALWHTCAALFIAAKVPAKAIQARLGHSSSRITMDTYGHLYEDASDHVADAMGATFAAPARRS
jgi:integrase